MIGGFEILLVLLVFIGMVIFIVWVVRLDHGMDKNYPPQQACPECNLKMNYIHKYQRWDCDRCKEYR